MQHATGAPGNVTFAPVMRFYFAHQSVGADIIAGVSTLAERNSGRDAPRIFEFDAVPHAAAIRAPSPADAPWCVIIHQKVGINREPLTKIAAFRAALEAQQRSEIDVAMLKFCYVDLTTPAEAQRLWHQYENMIEQLSTVHPGIRLVHCTVPLRTLPRGPYAWLRRMLGHRHPEIERNGARDAFNRRLRQRFGRPGELFDLAELQSRHATGRRNEYVDSGLRVPSLAPEWTDDGGHFNEQGRTMVAAAFIKFLQTLQDSRKR